MFTIDLKNHADLLILIPMTFKEIASLKQISIHKDYFMNKTYLLTF